MKPIGEIMKRITIPERPSGSATPPSSESDDLCPICRGAGYVRIDAPVNSPNFSRLIQCTCKQQERWARASRELSEQSNMAMIGSWTFESFDTSVSGTREAYEVARGYARDPYNWLVLIGDVGCGKTHLAAAVANYAHAELNMRPIFAVVPDLLDYLRAAFAPNSETRYETRFDAVRTADLLILDDLGTENTTAWAKEKLFQIVNHRYMERLPTVVTTNVDPERIETRIRSRLFDVSLSTPVFLEAADFRTRGINLRAYRPGKGQK